MKHMCLHVDYDETSIIAILAVEPAPDGCEQAMPISDVTKVLHDALETLIGHETAALRKDLG